MRNRIQENQSQFDTEETLQPPGIAGLFQNLSPISLSATNARASMQSRIDNKYIVDLKLLRSFIEATAKHYSVLEIESQRQFTYRSCYYDDHHKSYLEHHQGRRQRIKVRTRHYVDGGDMKYLEVKLKGPRGITIKHRQEAEIFMPEKIKGEQLQMLQDVYKTQYRKPLQMDLRPALIVGYTRCTLVARECAERVTVDYNLNFSRPGSPSSPVELGSDFIIVETKSCKGKGIADRALKNLRTRQASSCSKYCLGISLTDSDCKNNHFLSTLRRAYQNIQRATPKPGAMPPRLSLAV